MGLSSAQIKKMDETFNASRDRLIDLDGAVRKSEGGLQPMLDTGPDRSGESLLGPDRAPDRGQSGA